MGKILYWECGTGISGDMIVASLLDLGADENKLRHVLEGIREGGFEIEISRVSKSGIDCCDFNVVLDAEHENHDHDMAYLYGDAAETDHHGHDHHEHDHNHDHGQESCCTDENHHVEHHHVEHNHEPHHHDHEGHAHHHHHTNLADVTRIIEGLDMTERAREIAHRTFTIVAEAESKAHGLPIDQVHFHEVGAIDSIVDIVAAAVCLDDLGITEVIVPHLAEGTGTVRCQHGVLPVPVPAVLNIAAAYHLPIRIQANRKGELVTPTGAAFAAAVMTSRQLPETFIPIRVGLGAGKRAYEIPSILRAMLIEVPMGAGADRSGNGTQRMVDDMRVSEGTGADQSRSDSPSVPSDVVPEDSDADQSTRGAERTAARDTIIKLECNIDDSTGEQLGYAMEALFEAGARDVHYFPVIMKKSRPAWQLNVITDAGHREAMEHVIFKETTTIGIRRVEMERTVLARREETAQTPYGEIRIKICSGGDITRVYPEYESVAAAARKSGAAYAEVFRAAQTAAERW